MLAQIETCIYCGNTFDPAKGAGDHIIPASLGEFRGDVRFRRICPGCNNRIGRSEQQLTQCGPEGFYRDIVKPAVPAGRKRGRSRRIGAVGAPPPQATIDLGDHHEIVDVSRDNPRDARPVDQIILLDPEGREHFVRLYPGMTARQLRERVKATGVKQVLITRLSWDQARQEEFLALVRKTWPDGKFEEGSPIAPGLHRIRGRVKFTLTDHYFRALAKIAFHYYLAHTRRRFRGDEPCFSGIRNFIMKGGQIEELFHEPAPTFVGPPDESLAGFRRQPKTWFHLLAADETYGSSTVFVRLFVGPGSLPKGHYINLGSFPNRVAVPSFAWAHAYVYERNQPASGLAGQVESLPVFRIR